LKKRRIICKFQISAHSLRIESGRHEKVVTAEGQKSILERDYKNPSSASMWD
jgi:hypothetical protein